MLTKDISVWTVGPWRSVNFILYHDPLPDSSFALCLGWINGITAPTRNRPIRTLLTWTCATITDSRCTTYSGRCICRDPGGLL